ncbi:SdiA-regulated domain-containing protein [Halopseudomonas nanhaiensis]|uniref:SdiA-regulated domain-containing protein n=1 Tax=Halopseudomonas nanhaiensis TaxID=2830842 RepID=UPI001CC13C79|nr:SdiA-regulated domain-containing protein [Halopseudomonas nanhaiensis]UAW98841.1 SdiA-regulated domain-containing protein [Halopseudomonas nanhaiensis]
MKRAVLVVLLSVLGIAAVMRYLNLDTLFYQSWRLNNRAMPDGALNLGRYRVDIERKQVEGLDDDLSALTYNSDRNTLFAVINGTPLVVEIDLDGRVLRQIPIAGAEDMEGITHVAGDRYVIAEERSQRLLLVEIPDGVEAIDVSDVPSLQVALDADGNKGFEGVSWDAYGKRLLVVKERDPMRLLAIQGFVEGTTETGSISVSEVRSEMSSLFMTDLSSLTQHDESGHLLLLSDESHMLVEYDAENQPVSLMGLWRDMSGLANTVPQAEGVAVDRQGRVYIVSEPNLFYRFSPR